MLGAAGSLLLLAILGWTFTTMPDRHALTMPLLFLIHAATGLAMGGISLATGNIGLKLSPSGQAESYLTTPGLVNAVVAFVSHLLAGALSAWVTNTSLTLTLNLQHASRTVGVPAVSFVGLDFLFVVTFLLGLYAMHRLAFVNEQGSVDEKVVLDELREQIMEGVQAVASFAALRQVVAFTAGAITPALRRPARSGGPGGSSDRFLRLICEPLQSYPQKEILMPLGEFGKSVQSSVTGAIEGAGDVVDATVNTVQDTAVGTLRGAGNVAQAAAGTAKDVVVGAVQAAEVVGTEVGGVAKGAVIGFIRSVGEVTTLTAGILSDTVRAAIRGTSEVGADVGTLARNAAEGAITTTKSVGLGLQDAAFSIARGAIAGANDVGEDLGATAKNTIRGTIQGVEQIGGDATAAIRNTARGLVRGTADVGGDVGTVARAAVEGAIDAAEKVGVKATDAASAAMTGAAEAAEEVGTSAVSAVRGLVGTTIRGVKVPEPPQLKSG